MGRAPCCSKVGLHRGPWTTREDSLLTKYIQAHGEGHWRSLPKKAGLLRCGKSCRLRWMNYLRPDIKRGNITPDEDDLIIRLHRLLGNRWSLIAGRLPGRTDNEIKNYWNTHLSRKLISQGTDPNTNKKLLEPQKKRERDMKTSNSKKIQNNKVKTNAEPQKTTIHHPKPVRVTSFSCFSMSRNSSFDWNTGSRCSSFGGDGELCIEVNNVPWCSDNVIGVNVLISHDPDDDLLKGSTFEGQSQLPTSYNGTLEKLYEEYLQLLKAEENDHVQLDY
ncbi:unnamed protein product [Ilex paraguariensis]|uniref:Uncharacterized protein n=1 Tax=Ilex paraguariensis TaxID=185542 RepID=A0ABC8SCW1_9AQUA